MLVTHSIDTDFIMKDLTYFSVTSDFVSLEIFIDFLAIKRELQQTLFYQMSQVFLTL